MEPRENRLVLEQSPYLRQHRFDPVDWYPWGDDALRAAAQADKPLFVSIGYAACHWCHVMAHESFSDPETAALMNASVISVKVDREERPEVDAVYMEAVVASTGHGGWPMSVFATPDGRPFFAGTYFPKVRQGRMPSFQDVLEAVAGAWSERRDELESQASVLADAVSARLSPASQRGESGGRNAPRGEEVWDAVATAVSRLAEIADRRHGGFGTAPKFPQPLLLELLLRARHLGIAGDGADPLELVLEALAGMDSGGIYDHLGGGFSRYSTDSTWTVPHFEKMLYDQALLARLHLHAWQVTGDARWRHVLDETWSYVLDRLAHPSGALCASEDADSEGEEGRYYLWGAEEFSEAVGDELAAEASDYYGVTTAGNFEGRNVLVLSRGLEVPRRPPIEEARRRLLTARATRISPALDDKVLTEWNAMACAVLAETAAVTGASTYGDAALRIASVLHAAREENDGVTPRTLAAGYPISGTAADVAWLLEADVSLFELTGEAMWLERARQMAAELDEEFIDDSGVCYSSRRRRDDLFVRPVELADGVIPSAGSVASQALVRLGWLLGEKRYLERAKSVVTASRETLLASPTTVPELLFAAEMLALGQVVVVATGTARELLSHIRARYLPHVVFLPGDNPPAEAVTPLLAERADDAVSICIEGACSLPIRDEKAARATLEEALRARRLGS